MRNKAFIRTYWLMIVPGYAWLVLFSIVPMFGILMAFEDYNPMYGYFRSPWVGLSNFRYMFSMADSWSIIYNTVFIATMKVVLNLIFPLIFALLLNELRLARYKRLVQTVTYMPYFLSWVILAGILKDVLGYTGPINMLRAAVGLPKVMFFGNAASFPWLLILSDVWKTFGFNAIIYLAALTGISPSLYEAAAIDGAGRWRRLLHVTMPGIAVTVVMLMTLGLGGVLNAGFDQVFNMYNKLVYSTGDIIDTWVYRTGLINLKFSLATAVGLFKSVVGFILVALGYVLADRYAGYRIF
ncbi:MAG: sugar ABC transporter permease [Clostridiales bacterium]|nr:sugar ABC transporter permease [Clostridiales bacterium]